MNRSLRPITLALALVACGSVPASTGEAPTTTGASGGEASTVSSGGSGGMTMTSGGGVGGSGTGGEEGWTGVPTDRPLRLLFLGNSFTHQGPIPHLVRNVAASVGWPTPDVDYHAPGGQSLAFHRNSTDSLALVDAGAWDFVVLQDYSTRPTDKAGDPAAFKADATWFYDRIKAASSEAEVVLYETWARHPDHAIYPGTFDDPLQMQAQLRQHYNDAADTFIPAHASFMPATDVRTAPAGDAWENHLGGTNPLRLHAGDDYHAGDNGQYLNALVLYSSIYGVVATGASPLGLDAADAASLQAVADTTTGIVQLPPSFPQPELGVGQTLRLDFGTVNTPVTGWNVLTDCEGGSRFDMIDDAGNATGVDAIVASPFTGGNEAGVADNTLGYPGTVSSDVCWLGSFDGHAAALAETATVHLEDVDDGSYELTLFASRSGDDGGNGRLTRFTVAGTSQDLEVSDNSSNVVTFAAINPDATGQIAITIEVSPVGSARFGYLGALMLTKTAP